MPSRRKLPRQGSQPDEAKELLRSAEEHFPGVMELLKVYGGYQETIQTVQEYLDATRIEPFVATTDHCSPAAQA